MTGPAAGLRYALALLCTLYENTFRKPAGAADCVLVILGWCKFPTKNIRFFSNRFEGLEFGVTINDYAPGCRYWS